jgi:hypothetical protein
MFRKKRQPAPFFNMPGAPFNPATGERAPLGAYPVRGTTLAIFQVCAEDTHDDYIECRGFEADNDPNFRFLHDPHTAVDTTPINVAKPYGVRGTNPYVVGQIVVAARIKGRLGYNAGKGATTVGHPADLDEEIELLLDDDDVGIAWMDIDSSGTAVEESLFFWQADIDVDKAETDLQSSHAAGQMSGVTTFGGAQPVTSWIKLFTADTDLMLHFHFSGTPKKTTVNAGAAAFSIKVKSFNSSDVLVGSASTFTVDVPDANYIGAQIAGQYIKAMSAGDYVTVTSQWTGAYANLIELSNFGIYFRPIRES